MKKHMANPSIDEILQTLADKAKQHFDIIVEDPSLTTLKVGDLVEITHGEHTLKTNTHAETQLLLRGGINVGFYHKCPEHIQQQCVDYFCRPKKYTLRASKDNTCRAVMGPRYKTSGDDIYFFPTVLDELESLEGNHLQSFSYDDTLTRLLVSLGTTEYEEHTYYTSLTVSNSEVGMSSRWVYPSISWDGLTLIDPFNRVKSELGTKFTHKRDIDDAEVRAAINSASQISQVAMIKLLETSREELKGKDIVEFVDANPEIPCRFKSLLEVEDKLEQRFNKLELIRKILEATKELPLINQLLISKAVAKFSGVFDNLETRLANLQYEVAAVDVA